MTSKVGEAVAHSYKEEDKIKKWDLRFLELSKHISTWSKDPSTKVGAVIVRPDNTICSVGYNGFPARMEDKSIWYKNREEKYSRIIHGEINALTHTTESLKGYTLYTTPFACCDRCAVIMIGVGITTFVHPRLPKELEERWGKSLEKTLSYYRDCGVKYREYEVS